MTSVIIANPELRLKKLAFYDVLQTVLKPTRLCPYGQSVYQRMPFAFVLKPEQLQLIAENREKCNYHRYSYKVQVQMRFCSGIITDLESVDEERDDSFPPELSVKVNGVRCELYPDEPVDITRFVRRTANDMNSIRVMWLHEHNPNFYLSLYLVKKISVARLLDELNANSVKPPDFTRAIISEKFIATDNDIELTMLNVSLICPLTGTKIALPCRSSHCSHLQCFDAKIFLLTNEQISIWKCPICNGPASFEDLFIDGYTLEVVDSPLISNSIQMEVHADGSWTHAISNATIPPSPIESPHNWNDTSATIDTIDIGSTDSECDHNDDDDDDDNSDSDDDDSDEEDSNDSDSDSESDDTESDDTDYCDDTDYSDDDDDDDDGAPVAKRLKLSHNTSHPSGGSGAAKH